MAVGDSSADLTGHRGSSVFGGTAFLRLSLELPCWRPLAFGHRPIPRPHPDTGGMSVYYIEAQRKRVGDWEARAWEARVGTGGAVSRPGVPGGRRGSITPWRPVSSRRLSSYCPSWLC